MPDHAVRKHDHRVAIAKGEFETEVYEVGHLLYTVGGEDNGFVVAVSAATSGLVVVTLRGLNGAKAGTTALHIDDERRNFGAYHVADALLHEGNAHAR